MNVQKFLQEQNEKLKEFHQNMSHFSWMTATTGDKEWAQKTAQARTEKDVYYSQSELFEQVKKYRQEDHLSALEKRQLDLLYAQCVQNQLPEDTIKDINQLNQELMHDFNTYRAELNGQKVSENDIRQILIKSNDNQEREQAWYASKQIGKVVEERLIQLVKKRNEAAQTLGYRNHYEMKFALSELDIDEVFSTFQTYKEQSDDAFKQMKQQLDEELAERFNMTVDQIRPWHYADPFFQEAPASKALDLDDFYEGKDLEKLTLDTFELMGLEIQDMLKNSDLYPREGKNQHAFCSDLDRNGDIRVLSNNVPSDYWSATMLHEFGHAVYFKYVDQELPFLLRSYAHILSTEAIAMFFGRLAKNPVWLTRVLKLDAAKVDQMKEHIDNALRKQMLIATRWMMTFAMFERELYENPDQNLNRLWWEKVQEGQFVHPPENWDEPHWAAKIHFTLAPAYYQNYLLGELTTSQLHHYITQHVSSDLFTPEVGQFLIHEYFKLGNKDKWNEKLKKATGEELNPQYFVQQFV